MVEKNKGLFNWIIVAGLFVIETVEAKPNDGGYDRSQ